MDQVGLGHSPRVMVVGLDAPGLAASAARAGYSVCAVDYFGDLDLKSVCLHSQSIIQQRIGESSGTVETRYKPRGLLEIARRLVSLCRPQFMMLASGLDDSGNTLEELNELVPILGNSPSAIKRVRDKRFFLDELGRLSLPHPKTIFADDRAEAEAAAAQIGFPLVMKPWSTSGGTRIELVKNTMDLAESFARVRGSSSCALVQRYVPGIPASVSVISASGHAKSLAASKQILGDHRLFQQHAFGWCGNVVPISMRRDVTRECMRIAEEVCVHFKLVGSNGVDFVISPDGHPYVIEVNPRFQGTLECVEKAFGLNVVKMHVNACLRGKLPAKIAHQRAFCTRLIVYAPERCLVPDFRHESWLRNVPLPGSLVEKGEPVCSVLALGRTEGQSLGLARRRASKVLRALGVK
ncbi:MAG: ATP-grasp domain-containing protein [Aigarchaeota archaeon]|nr:ATP-grasp domain-containing protein [Aigarchaeota archaeon]